MDCNAEKAKAHGQVIDLNKHKDRGGVEGHAKVTTLGGREMEHSSACHIWLSVVPVRIRRIPAGINPGPRWF